jgi:hypothetical protein
MPEALADHLEVGASSEEPRGMGVAKVVHADLDLQPGGLDGREPDAGAEPARRNVAVGVDGATIDEALTMLREAVEVYFSDSDVPELPPHGEPIMTTINVEVPGTAA